MTKVSRFEGVDNTTKIVPLLDICGVAVHLKQLYLGDGRNYNQVSSATGFSFWTLAIHNYYDHRSMVKLLVSLIIQLYFTKEVPGKRTLKIVKGG